MSAEFYGLLIESAEGPRMSLTAEEQKEAFDWLRRILSDEKEVTT